MSGDRIQRFCSLFARVAVGAAVVLPIACAKPPPPYAATSNRTLDEEGVEWKPVLSAEERGRTMDAMRGVAEGHEPADHAAPAPGGMRFSDLRPALAAACRDVEAAVVRTVEEEDGLHFHLRTIEDWPGLLVVRRAEGPEVYEIVELSFGRFPDDPDKLARAEALRGALHRWMLEYGAKRRFNEPEAE
jgi:hypothetical protein